MDNYSESGVTIDEEDRRDFLKLLGITGGVGAVSQFTLADLRAAVEGSSSADLAAMGEAIRADLAGSLDASVLAGALDGVASAVETLPELRAQGFPDENSTAYQDLTDPAWGAYEHLADVGFFASTEEHLPAFTTDYLATTARGLVQAEPLTATLLDVGFDEQELAAAVTSVTSQQDTLQHWVPTTAIPDDVSEFDPSHVSPLHQRATGGALLWIDSLDDHLWRNEVLITEEMYDLGIRHSRAMLGGFHLMTTAARDMAGPGELADDDLAAGLAGGAAIMIAGQENIAADLYRITDDMRATGGGFQQ